MPMIEIRICTACGEPLPETEFCKVSYGDGLQKQCKKCRKIREKLRYNREKTKILEKKKERNRQSRENPIDVVNKTLERGGICWLDNLRIWHENKFGGKKDAIR